MTMKPSDVDRRVISPVRNGTDTGVPLTCEDTGDGNLYGSEKGHTALSTFSDQHNMCSHPNVDHCGILSPLLTTGDDH